MTDFNYASEYLKRVGILEWHIKRDKERLEELEASAYSVRAMSYDNSKVQTSMTDVIADKAIALTDLRQKIADEIIESELTKDEIIRTVNSLENEQSERILYLRYIRQLNFYDIADEMSYSLRMVHRIHSKALSELNEMLTAK